MAMAASNAVRRTAASSSPTGAVCASTPAGPVPSKRSPELEDLDLDLPEDEAAIDNSDEGFSPEDDSDIDLVGDEEDEESIGLDTALGFDDSNDDLELPEDGEGERWSGESDDSDDLPGTDADLLQGEEYGWIDEEADASDDDESFDPEWRDDEGPARDDGGAEGVDDDADLDELDLSQLPELGSEQDEELAAAGDFEELPELGEEPTYEVAPGEHWKALAAGAVRITQLSQLPAACTDLALHGARLFVAAGGLWELASEGNTLRSLPLSAANPSALAVADLDGVAQLAVIAAEQTWLSSDGGASFALAPQGEAAIGLAFTAGANQPVLWCLNSAGALRSGQRRESQAVQAMQGKVSGVFGDGDRRLIALVRRQNRLWLAVSRDAAKRFAFVELPSGAAETGSRIAGCRDALLLRTGVNVYCGVLPQALQAVPLLLPNAACLCDEDDEVFLYGCVQRGERLLLVRRAARSSSAPMLIAALPAELGCDVQQLAVHYAEAGAICAYLVCGGWLVRIEASLDGEDLA
jgi:hypothetical protein